MSEKKTSSVLNFFKRNLYYLLIGVALITIITVTAIVIATSGKNSDLANKPSSEKPSASEPVSEYPSIPDKPGKPDQPDEPDKPSEPDKPDDPVDAKIEFVLPVAGATIGKEFTSSTVVFNKTLGVYTGHMGVDFNAEAGAEVLCAYEGTIESIETTYLQGTTITVNHGNGLKTVYNSVEAKEGLKKGQKVAKGEVIATVSDNNRQEYKDGAHLHFEVYENETKVDPNKYLMLSQK